MTFFTSITKLPDGSWRFEWDADSGVSFDIWLHGKLVDTADEGEYTCAHSIYYDTEYTTTPPPIEVVEEGEDAESLLYPPFQIFQWRGVAAAFVYVVSNLVDSVLTAQAHIQETLKSYYKYQTKVLPDVEDAVWEIEAQTTQGLSGATLDFAQLMARNPDPPSVEIEYTSDGKFVISEA